MSSRPWVVLKYGGTSVANVRNWGEIVKRVQLLLPTNRVWLVVSALSGVRARHAVLHHIMQYL